MFALGQIGSGDKPAGSASSSARAADPVTVTVTPDAAFSADIPNVGRLSGDTGSVTETGTVTVTPHTVELDDMSLLRSAGTGFDVTFQGTELAKPLHL